ncbi:unnamed protein product [Nippostrongylus brasiliensis]|uniref:Phosphotransferase n=1 Tax=Nippostrongylus brasiliensis TaxID=27835 RepID=A0A0N4YAK5_NIPBR|nr:unnamed protein product [Nippostrongylus brasiliensis]
MGRVALADAGGERRAKLIHWTKGFSASGCEGQDVVGLLRKALKRRGGDIEIDVVAVLNDTVGTLMACAFKENSCMMGVIVGTGTNACYMERLKNVPKLKGEWENDGLPDENWSGKLVRENSSVVRVVSSPYWALTMILNMEWGAFGDDGVISFAYTDYDKEVDRSSINPGKQLFEKMISGMYMGELVRIVLEKLARKKVVFNGDTVAISKKNCFLTKHVSDVEAELEEGGREKSFPRTREILREIGVENITDQDCLHVAYVCTAVSTR